MLWAAQPAIHKIFKLVRIDSRYQEKKKERYEVQKCSRNLCFHLFIIMRMLLCHILQQQSFCLLTRSLPRRSFSYYRARLEIARRRVKINAMGSNIYCHCEKFIILHSLDPFVIIFNQNPPKLITNKASSCDSNSRVDYLWEQKLAFLELGIK